MAFRVEFRVDNLEETRRNLGLLIGLWRIRAATTLRRWGIDLTRTAISLSPEDKLRGIDPRRRSASRRFATHWKWELDRSGLDPILNVGNVDERMRVIVFPTAGNSNVTPRRADYLKFWNADGSGPFRRGRVNRKPLPGQPVHLWTLKAFDLDHNVKDLANDLVR